jgi:hypothetical protein
MWISSYPGMSSMRSDHGLRVFRCLFNWSDSANALLPYERQIARPQLVALASAMIALELASTV